MKVFSLSLALIVVVVVVGVAEGNQCRKSNTLCRKLRAH